MNKLVYYAGIYTVSAGLLKLAGFVLFLWLARTLSVDDYASFGLFYSLQTGLITFGLVGIVEAIVGLLKVHRSVEEQRVLFAVANSTLSITLVSSIVFALLVFVIFINQSEISFLTLACVLVSGSLMAYSTLQSQIVRLEEKHLSSLCFSFVLPLAGLVGSLVAFYHERTVQSFFLGSAIGLLISVAGLWISRVGFYGVADRLIETRPILLRVTPFIAVAFLGWLSGYGNNYVIKLLFDSKEVAKFTFAFGLSSIMQLIASALNQVWAPRFYRITHELPFEQVEKKNLKFYRIQGFVLGLFGGIVIAAFPSAMSMIKGNLVYYQSMTLELVLLFSSYVILSPYWHCSNYFLAYDKGPDIMRITVITSTIGIFAWIILMWWLGSIGIYIGFLTQMLLRSVGITFAAKKYWPVKVSWDGVVVGILLTSLGFIFSKM